MEAKAAAKPPATGRHLVGCYIWLDHAMASDYASLVPDPATPLLVERHRAGTYFVRLPGGAVLPLPAKYVATVPPEEQRRIDREMGIG